MSLAKYKGFIGGQKLPAENVNSINPVSPSIIGKLLGGQNISPTSKWALITAPVGETQEISTTSTSSYYDLGESYRRISQSFTATKAFLTFLSIYVTKYGSPTGSIFVDLYNCNASDEPTGSILKTVEIVGSKIVNGENGVSFDKFQLTVGNKYCFVLRDPSGNSSHRYHIYYGSPSSLYTGGDAKYSNNSGSSWSNLNGDLWMKIYMATAPDSYPRYSINVDDVLYSNNYLNLPYLSDARALYNENGSSSYEPIYSTIAVGQTFTVVDRNYFSKCIVNLAKYGSPTGNVTLGIYEISGGYPTGSALAEKSLDVSTLSTSQTAVEFAFASPIELEPGKQYAFKVTLPGNNSSNCVRIYIYTSSSVYSGGNEIKFDGSTWSQYTSADLIFALYAAYVAPKSVIAQYLQTQIRALTGGSETVEYVDSRFIVKAADSVLKLISPSSGADISGNVSDGATGYYLDLGTNATETARLVDPDDIVRVGTDKQIPGEILSNAIKLNMLQSSRGFSDNSGRVTIAHTLGRLPKVAMIKAMHAIPHASASQEANTTLLSDGFSDGTNNKCTYVAHTSIGDNPYYPMVGDGNSSSKSVYMKKMLSGDSYRNSYLLQEAAISFDEYNVYIDWTKTSGGQSPSSISGTFYLTILLL